MSEAFCLCGAQPGYGHEPRCPFPYYRDTGPRASEWYARAAAAAHTPGRNAFENAEAVRAAKRAGNTRVKTYGGFVALDEWTPYSVKPEELEYIVLFFDPAEGSIKEIALPHRREAGATRTQHVTGVWEVV